MPPRPFVFRSTVRSSLGGAMIAAAAVAGLVLAVGQREHSAAAAPAPAVSIGSLRIIGAYIPQPASASVAAAYFTVQNTGAADALTAVSSDVSRDVGLHETVDDGTVGKMVAVSQLVVPAGGSAVLTPGGRHLMLTNPTRPLRAGHTVTLTLRFAHAGTATLPVPVVALASSTSAGAAGDMANMTGMS